MELKPLKKLRYLVFTVLVLASLGSVVVSLIISVKYIDTDAVFLCLLGAAWTIASLLIFVCGIIGLYNTLYMNEKPQKKEYYDINGKKKIFRYKEKYIKLNDLKNFLVNTKHAEKIFILFGNNTFSVLEVYIEIAKFPVRRYLYDTREFFLDDESYKNIDDIVDLLSKNYIYNDDSICVLDYEHSSPYYLKKRIDEMDY